MENIYVAVDAKDERLTGKTLETLITNREIAFLSKKLASIVTDLDIEMPPTEAFEYASRKLISPEATELFRTLEFKSLLPKNEQVMQSFSDLQLAIRTVDTTESFTHLRDTLTKLGSFAISTVSLSGSLSTIVISLLQEEKEEIYVIDVRSFLALECIEFILHFPGTIIGYDLKEDIKALRSYSENARTPIMDGEQIGMLF